MTNNGDIINKMMRAGNRHEKEYKVTVDKEITKEFLEKMASGVPILDTVTRPCRNKKIGKYIFSIVLTQGSESADPKDVRSTWISGEGADPGSDHEHSSGASERRGIQKADGCRVE